MKTRRLGLFLLSIMLTVLGLAIVCWMGIFQISRTTSTNALTALHFGSDKNIAATESLDSESPSASLSVVAFFSMLPRALLSNPATFGDFPLVNTLEEAQQQIVQFKIRVPPQPLLPAGYRFVGAVVDPLGPVITDPATKRTFRPELVTMYYWNQSLKPDLFLTQFEEAGGIFIEESYAAGVNDTGPFGPAVNRPPSFNSVGWFHGYPAIWRDGYARVFQFDKNMSYSVMGNTLSREQALAIVETFLKEPTPREAKTNTITKTTVTTETTRTQTVTSAKTVTATTTVSTVLTATTTTVTTTVNQATDPSTYAWALSATVATVVLAVVLLLRRAR